MRFIQKDDDLLGTATAPVSACLQPIRCLARVLAEGRSARQASTQSRRDAVIIRVRNTKQDEKKRCTSSKRHMKLPKPSCLDKIYQFCRTRTCRILYGSAILRIPQVLRTFRMLHCCCCGYCFCSGLCTANHILPLCHK